MIAVDTSALMEILLEAPRADACDGWLERSDRTLISAETLAEALIVADRRSVGAAMRTLLHGLAPEIIAVDRRAAEHAADAYSRWGKGVHPAALNCGDCFASVLARTHDAPLLFVGNDFCRTDVRCCLERATDLLA